ncbi:MAG: right-handed parallel beta-helix repeat-containing protein [Solirubrobacterales bacterium]|nr:right-handed parallel beta-helix repeat-containing protein [Solirubrobacterales bacterium]
MAIWSGSESASAASGCDLVVAPDGSDSAAGTDAAPLKSVTTLLGELQSGQTGCLREGTYVDRQFEIRTPGVTLTSYPGERATLRGQLRIGYKADGSVAENMNLDGRNSDGLLGPLIYADDVILRGNDITNHHESICVAVSSYKNEGPTRGVLIEDNVIHDCGELPATNHHHGIYVSNATGTVIRGNVIYGNADRGVQLYPNADDSVVTGNIIDGNGEGVIFGGGRDSSSDDNLVANNVITGSTIRWNIQSNWQGPVGSGNIARGNCVWSERGGYYGGRDPEGGGIQEMSGARAFDNVVADPGYADANAGNYRVSASSPCLDVLGGKLPQVPEQPSGPEPGSDGESACAPTGGVEARRSMVGGQHRDRLIGGSGSDRLAGKGGGDKIVGGNGGPDCLLGGSGPDRIRAVNGRRDVVTCGHGRDRATVERGDRVRGCERVIVRRHG